MREPGLEVSEVADGLVVYQTEVERVHYLNASASLVFELCTGENPEREIPGLLAQAYGVDEVSDSEVLRCLEHLRGQGVIR